MGYGYGGWGAGHMALGGGPDVLGVITWVVVIIDLILVGFWLWKQIKKGQ